MEITSHSLLKENNKKAIESVGTATLEERWKNMKARNNKITTVNGGHIGQDNVRIISLENPCYNVY